MLKEKDYELKERTAEENEEFLTLLLMAETNLSQAVSAISYPDCPKANRGTLDVLQGIIGNISQVECDVSRKIVNLMKPVKPEDTVEYFYELQYFRRRKDTGSIYIKTDLLISNFVEEDDFLMSLVDSGVLNKSDVDSIMYIVAIDEDTYRRMMG